MKGLQTEEMRDAASLRNGQGEEKPVANWGGVGAVPVEESST